MAIHPSAKIHPTAIVDPSAKIHEGVEIGPYCIIGPNVSIFEEAYIGPSCIIGDYPEKKNFFNHTIYGVIIGANSRLTKQVTVDCGIEGETTIYRACILLKGAHIGHDAKIGTRSILCCNACIGGYARIDEDCYVGLNASLHQKAKMQRGSCLGGNSFLKGEIPEFQTWGGVPAKFIKFNKTGMDRAGFVCQHRWTRCEYPDGTVIDMPCTRCGEKPKED